jgi:hypothetical protein
MSIPIDAGDTGTTPLRPTRKKKTTMAAFMDRFKKGVLGQDNVSLVHGKSLF